MKVFTAVTKSDTKIISVLADHKRDAKRQIRTELSKNPSRKAFLDKWVEDGELVEEKGQEEPK